MKSCSQILQFMSMYFVSYGLHLYSQTLLKPQCQKHGAMETLFFQQRVLQMG